MHVERKKLQSSRAGAVLPDYATMVASLLASQSVSAAAIAQVHHNVARSIENAPEQALATLMQARPGWRAAAGVLGGSFHRGIARMVNANSL